MLIIFLTFALPTEISKMHTICLVLCIQFVKSRGNWEFKNISWLPERENMDCILSQEDCVNMRINDIYQYKPFTDIIL